MLITDPIGDMLTRIKNAQLARKKQVVIPHSKMKTAIAQKMVENNYIKSFEVVEKKPQSEIVVELRYVDSLPAITGLKRVSKPGRRLYSKVTQIPSTLGGYGMTIVSTSKGILTDKEARQQSVGGELICQVW
ncbi:MAG: 30S ribosomal protein S8 [Candidatus Pacebacteria bacterium]|nr:30S ribosomal protein S8 [Candidatus Paceibacterota bacterium]